MGPLFNIDASSGETDVIADFEKYTSMNIGFCPDGGGCGCGALVCNVTGPLHPSHQFLIMEYGGKSMVVPLKARCVL